MKNYYQILDVSCDADPETLKRAYRRMAKKVHPDHRQGDLQAEERFKELQEAYAVLSDPAKRDRYDVVYLRHRANRARRGTAAGRSSMKASGAGRPGVTEVVGDVFELIKSRMQNRGKRGEDYRYMLSLTLEEAALGARKDIHIPRSKICAACSGRGWNTVSRSPVCESCRGEGEITVPQKGGRRVVPCPACGGSGLNEKIVCRPCRGKGVLSSRQKRSVDIPAGVDNGSRLKLRGEGGAGENGGESGDLYIIIQVEDHARFKRENLDVWTDLSLHFTDAALGADVTVPTLEGERKLRVPPGTQPEEVLVLEGCGIRGLNGSQRGDQKIRVHVQVPRRMTPQERAILKRWKAMRHPE